MRLVVLGRSFFVAAALCAVCANGLDAAVSSPKSRREVLAEVRNLLEREAGDPPVFGEFKYPFSFPVEAPPEPAIVEDDGDPAPAVVARPVQPVVPERVIRPEEVLADLAKNLKIRGVIRDTFGDPFLVLPGGRVPEGQLLRVKFEEKSFIVVVASISEDAYRLELDNKALEVSLKPTTKGYVGFSEDAADSGETSKK